MIRNIVTRYPNLLVLSVGFGAKPQPLKFKKVNWRCFVSPPTIWMYCTCAGLYGLVGISSQATFYIEKLNTLLYFIKLLTLFA